MNYDHWSTENPSVIKHRFEAPTDFDVCLMGIKYC